MTDQKITSSIQHKLMVKLLEYNFQLEYRSGKENIAANILSRKHSFLAISIVTPEWIKQVEASYLQDPHCKTLLEQLLLAVDHTVNKNTLHGGVIRHKGRIYVGKDTTLRNKLLKALHSSTIGSHSGRKASYRELKESSIGQASNITWIRLWLNAQSTRKTKVKTAHILVS